MSVIVTHATVHDIPRIQQIAVDTWPATFGAILSHEQIQYMLEWMYSTESLRQQMEKEGHLFLLATHDHHADDRAVGYASYASHYLTPHTTKIHKLYVRPDGQGLGIGRMLLDTIRTAAAAAGQETMTLNVNRYNPAIQFYERYGFTTIGTEDIPIGNGYLMNDVIMTLRV